MGTKRRRPAKTRNQRPAKSAKLPAVHIRAVDFVMYCTRDMPKTRRFYQELFGLERGDEWNRFWSEFTTKPVTLCLNGTIDRVGWDWQGPPAIAFAVDNIHAAIEE